MRALLGCLMLLLVGCDPGRTPGAPEISNCPPMPPATPSTPTVLEKATFGAGCFWGVEHVFRQVPGVTDAAVGYAGGKVDNPTYRQVCSGTTSHAEVVEVTFDPSKVGYARLVDVFFKIHDPTTLNRQGPDVGDQYRSVIFYHSEAQRQVAEQVRDQVARSGRHRNPIVTFIQPAPRFWRAEEYHQRYVEKNGGPSCHILPE